MLLVQAGTPHFEYESSTVQRFNSSTLRRNFYAQSWDGRRMKIRAVSRSFYPVCLLGAFLAALLAQPIVTPAQERRTCAWFSSAWRGTARSHFGQRLRAGSLSSKGFKSNLILIRGGPAAIAALVSGEVDLRPSA